jgi:hypothetical protein
VTPPEAGAFRRSGNKTVRPLKKRFAEIKAGAPSASGASVCLKSFPPF